MSFRLVLSSITQTLSATIRPHVQDEAAKHALEACIRGLSGLTAAFEAPAGEPSPPLPNARDFPPTAYTRPPETLAANATHAAAVKAGEQWLASGGWLKDSAQRDAANALLAWESAIEDTRITLMDSLTDGARTESAVVSLDIDRDALERYLKARYPDDKDLRIATFRQVFGGRSRQTALFTLEGATSIPAKLAVQRDHPAGLSPYGVAGQFPFVKVVADSGVKTPRPVFLETDKAVISAPFVVMEQVSGAVAGADYFHPPQTPALAYELAEQLALLHRADLSALPAALSDNSLSWPDDLAAIDAAWRKHQAAPSMAFAAALAWMRAHVQDVGNERSIVHTDTAFHNILIENGHLSAILDWELVHVGHPGEDLGYCRGFVEEMADWDEFMRVYTAHGGCAFSRTVIDYFSLRAGVKLMTLLQGGRAAFESGLTDDVNLAEVATSFVPRLHRRIARVLKEIVQRA
ncbi:MAG: phosphotransferase family protein [Caulobacterales bacterium]